MFASETASDISLREWLIKLSTTHGPLKVFSASSACAGLYSFAKVDSFLSSAELVGEAYEAMTGGELSPCMVIPDEFWKQACELGLLAASVAGKIVEGTGIDELAFPAFMRACVSFVVL